eukprot:969131-Amorphochlora_amoeboformis.AAC.2
MAVDVQRSYGVPRIYHPAVLVVLWTVVKSAVIVSVSTILYHILEAQAKIRNRNVPEPVFYVCVGVAAFAFCMDLAELISALFSSAGALFTAIQFFIFSVVSLFTFKPMVFVREQQQDTVEALRSSRKEGFHRTINDHGGLIPSFMLFAGVASVLQLGLCTVEAKGTNKVSFQAQEHVQVPSHGGKPECP